MKSKILSALTVAVVALLAVFCIAVWVGFFLLATLILGADPWPYIRVAAFLASISALMAAAAITAGTIIKELAS